MVGPSSDFLIPALLFEKCKDYIECWRVFAFQSWILLFCILFPTKSWYVPRIVTKSRQARDRLGRVCEHLDSSAKWNGGGITCTGQPGPAHPPHSSLPDPCRCQRLIQASTLCANVDNSLNCVFNRHYIWKHQKFKQNTERLGLIQTFSYVFVFSLCTSYVTLDKSFNRFEPSFVNLLNKSIFTYLPRSRFSC